MSNMMAAQPNIGGALCECSVIPFLVPCHKVWLTAAARVSRSNAANVGERKLGLKVNFAPGKFPLWGKSPQNVYIVTAKHPTKFVLTSVERHRCSNEAKTRNRLKFAGVPQTRERISAVSGPTFAIL